jgi:hypothetical protein
MISMASRRSIFPSLLMCSDGNEDATPFDASAIGAGHPLDHVGVRVRAPYDRHLEWYARNLGFCHRVNTYTPNDDPLKNMREYVGSFRGYGIVRLSSPFRLA